MPGGKLAVKFYLTAILFILFDVELIFLYPWAVNYRELATTGSLVPLWDMLAFLALLAVAYAYLWRKGIFDWGRRRKTAPERGRGR